MADYYPLLAKAVAGLSDPTPEARSAIYNRARQALLGQLRRLEPPIPAEEIERESVALEVSVARLEAEFAPAGEPEAAAPAASDEPATVEVLEEPASAEPAPPVEAQPAQADPTPHEPDPAPQPAPVPPPAEADPGEGSAEPPKAAEQPSSLSAPRPPMFFKVRRDKPPLFPPVTRPEGFSARRPSGPAPSLRSPPATPSVPPSDESPAVAAVEPASTSVVGEQTPAREPDFPELPAHDAEPESPGSQFASENAASFDERPSDPHAAFEPAADDFSAVTSAAAGEIPETPHIAPALARPRPDAQRPFAPQPPRDGAAPRRLWIVGFIVGLLVFLVAIAAFELRDRPEELRQKAAAPVIAPEAGPNGKIVDRIGAGSDASQSAAPPSPDASAAKSAAPAPEPAVQSARRAALLVEAADEPSKVKTYLGAVTWKVDNVSNGPGDPLSMAVNAEIDIPEEKLQVLVTFQKNFDGSLPASHTIKIQFTEGADRPLGNVQQISVPQMRAEDTATGDALSGVPVSITDNSFLVGLSRGPAEATNLDLLKSREWMDVPMLLSNGKIAKLTFEKGPAGDSAVDDALAAWKTQ